MIHRLKQLYIIGFLAIALSCAQPGGNNPGSEFVPDMGHSIAYEANYYDYYKYNTWGDEVDYHTLSQPREPVAGTIPRGYAGDLDARKGGYGYSINGFVPYYYEDTEEERTRAMEEIIDNPYPISSEGLAIGKELYDIYCGICHGEKGDGNGWLVDETNPNQVYPAQPSIMTSDDFIESSNGRYYHSIIYGKNLMGSYADKLSFEDRWQVVHYIRSLQAKEKGMVYNEKENTLNDVDIPMALWDTDQNVHMGDQDEEAVHEEDKETQPSGH